MQNKPVDVGRLGVIRCVIAPEPRMTPEGDVRRDREGNPQWITGLNVRQIEGRRMDDIHVVTSVQPQGLIEGAEVQVVNLWANDWNIDGNSGTSYRADAILPTSGPGSSASGGSSAGPASGARGKSGGGES